MSSLATIREAIATKLEGIAGVGLVHRYERYASRQEPFRALYETGGQVRGWHIRRITTSERSTQQDFIETTHRWRITGYMALDDDGASELAFDDIVEAIRLAFRDDTDLGGVIVGHIVGDRHGVQVVESGPVMFAGVLCHSATLEIDTETWTEE